MRQPEPWRFADLRSVVSLALSKRGIAASEDQISAIMARVGDFGSKLEALQRAAAEVESVIRTSTLPGSSSP